MKTPKDLVLVVGGDSPLCESHDFTREKDIPIGGTPALAVVDGFECRKCHSLFVSKKVGDAAIVGGGR